MSCCSKEPKILVCEASQTVVEVLLDRGNEPVCSCGKPMRELKPNTSEGASEKHLPVVEQEGNLVTVKVGSVYHPMSEEHQIGWVGLLTNRGWHRVDLPHTAQPVASFALVEGDTPVAAYAWCNLHGFWKTDIEQ